MAISKMLVNLNYLLPSAGLWNSIHDGHVKDGGVWHYGEKVEQDLENFIERRHASYASAWDVACNNGALLGRLAAKHPERSYFGSDISEVMVNATRERCPTCIAEVFDVNALQSSEFRPIAGRIPEPVDLIIVADVLYYMSWSGLPPLLNYALPASWTREHRHDFWQHLTGLARKEVIFSGHQGNTAVKRFLTEMGATFIASHNVWVTPGMWGKVKFDGKSSSSGYWYPRLYLLCGLVIVTFAMVSYRKASLKSKARQ